MIRIVEKLQWHVVVLLIKPVLIALVVAAVDVGLLDGVILRHVEQFLVEARTAVEAEEHRSSN